MNLQGELLQLTAAKLNDVHITPSEKDPTISVLISADMTPVLAEMMRCRPLLYNDSGEPHAGFTRVDLGEAKLREVDVSLPSIGGDGGFDLYRPELIYKFSFSREIGDDDKPIRVHMRLRFKGREEEFAAFSRRQNVKPFEFAIRSQQQYFNWTGASGSGTRVELSNGDQPTSIESSPLFQNATQNEIAQQLECPCGFFCAADEPETLKQHQESCAHVTKSDLAETPRDVKEPAIADARVMGQAKKKQQQTRAAAAAPATSTPKNGKQHANNGKNKKKSSKPQRPVVPPSKVAESVRVQ